MVEMNATRDTEHEQPTRTYFGRKLEAFARSSLEELKYGSWNTSPSSVIDREIALTLDHMDRMKDLEERQKKNLLDVECAIDTELMSMEARTPRYSDKRFPEWERFQRQLHQIESERRNMMAFHESQRQALEAKLLILMNRRAQLGGKRGS